jgi:hypothetical protein
MAIITKDTFTDSGNGTNGETFILSGSNIHSAIEVIAHLDGRA